MRLFEDAAHGDAADYAGELQGCRRYRALANRYGDGFSRVPFAVEHSLHPFLAGDQAALFGGQIDAGAMAEAEVRSVVGDPVNPEALSYVVKEDVARLHNRLV